MLHIISYWPLMGLGIYMGVSHPNVYTILLSIIACLILLASGIKLCQRWHLFKMEESTVLSINVEQKTFIYKHNDIAVNFNSNEIKLWQWQIYRFDPNNSILAEIVEIKLKNGQKIILSNGIGNVLDFLRDNWKELGLPEGKRSYSSLRSYMKEIKD